MICPEQRLKSFLNQNNNNNNNNINQRNSICIELTGCSIDESSTDDCQLIKSSSDRYWAKSMSSTMNIIDQHETILSTQPLTVIEEHKANHDDNGTDEEEKGKEVCLCQSFYIPVKLIALQFVSFLFPVQYHHHYLTIITTVNRHLSFFHHLRQQWMLL